MLCVCVHACVFFVSMRALATASSTSTHTASISCLYYNLLLLPPSAGGANPYLGIDGHKGVLADMVATGVLDPFAVRAQVLKSSIEAACMLLRIDDILSGMKSKQGGGPAPPQPTEEEGGE